MPQKNLQTFVFNKVSDFFRRACFAAITLCLLATPSTAKEMRTNVSFNTTIHKKTANQPPQGTEVSYEVALKGGALDGCSIRVVELMDGRDDGKWGFFDIAGEVICSDGEFAYVTSGVWDGNGFHASGTIINESGSGKFKDLNGRVAQLGGTVIAAKNKTLNVSYELVFDPVKK